VPSATAPQIDVLLAELRTAEAARGNALMVQLKKAIDRDALTLLHGWLLAGDRQGDAEDLYQDFLIALPRLLRSYRGDRPGSAWKWVKVVLLNRARDHLRRSRERPTATGDAAELDHAVDPAEREGDGDAPTSWPVLLTEQGWSVFVDDVLSSLRTDYRADMRRNLEILRDHYCHGEEVPALALKYFAADDPAARNKVSQYMLRARAKLREAWQRTRAPMGDVA
jgi:DNA-directed RNA polymerase specialized sigma24 family protein